MTIGELSGNYQGTIRELSGNYQGTVGQYWNCSFHHFQTARMDYVHRRHAPSLNAWQQVQSTGKLYNTAEGHNDNMNERTNLIAVGITAHASHCNQPNQRQCAQAWQG